MSIIEGVGDEVTQFFVVLLCGLLVLVAWWSTANRPAPFRTILVMERSVRSVGRMLPRRIATLGRHNSSQRNSIEIYHPNDSGSSEESISRQDTVDSHISEDAVDSAAENVTNEAISERTDSGDNVSRGEQPACESSSPEAEMNNIVNAMDTDTNILRNRRLAFFKNTTSDTPESAQAFSTSEASQLPAVDGSSGEAGQEAQAEEEAPAEDQEEDGNTKSDDSIRIRLKYLNDDLKLVEGSLQEPLGEFKRRHFRGELSACKLVRLIFNGQVLQGDAATLASCGLFDNCVVHCLVHQPRTAQQLMQAQQQMNPPTAAASLSNNLLGDIPLVDLTDSDPSDEREWDLGNILLTTLASVLSVAWYCHLRFSSQFGVATTLAMLGLTFIYLITVVCVYFPEAQQPVATPPAAAGAPPTPPASASSRDTQEPQAVN